MLRLVGGLALVGALLVGCGEQQPVEPASRAEDRTAQLDQRQMITEDGDALRSKAAPAAADALPDCHELGTALGERAEGMRLLPQPVDAKNLNGDAAAAAADAPEGLSDGSALGAAPKTSVRPVKQRCEWRSRPTSDEPSGLVLTIERTAGQIRRTDVAGHVVDLPTVERAGGFLISPTSTVNLDGPLSTDGAQIVIGQLSVRISAPNDLAVRGHAPLDMTEAIAAALDVHRVLVR